MIELRSVEPADAAYILENWAGENPLPGYAFPADRAGVIRLIEEWTRGVHRGARFEMLMILRDGLPVGLLSLYQKGRDVSLGISVHPLHQRQGVASEAVRQAMEHAGKARWENLISECREDNEASVALHAKCGFWQTGRYINGKGNVVLCWKAALK